jgi:hypothetical protein
MAVAVRFEEPTRFNGDTVAGENRIEVAGHSRTRATSKRSPPLSAARRTSQPVLDETNEHPHLRWLRMTAVERLLLRPADDAILDCRCSVVAITQQIGYCALLLAQWRKYHG